MIVHAVVVVAHPKHDSFTHAVAGAARDGLIAGGHTVTTLDLYAAGFSAAMSAEERLAYHSGQPIIDDLVRRHADAVLGADALVFVYPTWWSSMPAMLKGWLERVMVEGVSFRFDDRHRVRPALGSIRRIVGISTYGSPRLYVRAINDNGRRILTRALRLSTGWRTRTTWRARYKMDSTTPAKRQAFLGKVRSTMAGL